MARLLRTYVLDGHIIVKVYSPSRSDLAGQTRARYQKGNRAGAMYIARERGLKKERDNA